MAARREGKSLLGMSARIKFKESRNTEETNEEQWCYMDNSKRPGEIENILGEASVFYTTI